MAEKTVIKLIDDVYKAAVNIGMDVSPKDVAFIISLFLEGFTQIPPAIPEVDAWIIRIAEAVNTITDE